jgi:hypothetical protein
MLSSASAEPGAAVPATSGRRKVRNSAERNSADPTLAESLSIRTTSGDAGGGVADGVDDGTGSAPKAIPAANSAPTAQRKPRRKLPTRSRAKPIQIHRARSRRR